MNVTFKGHDDDVRKWGGCEETQGVLTPHDTYRVIKREVHSYHTKVWLQGVPSGRGFNSAHFEVGE